MQVPPKIRKVTKQKKNTTPHSIAVDTEPRTQKELHNASEQARIIVQLRRLMAPPPFGALVMWSVL